MPPKKNTALIFYVALQSQATPWVAQANPTIAAGDFKVSTDGGALANLGTLPTVTPASGKMVKITLSAGEMNGDNVTVVCSDAAGAEWGDLVINIQTTARQIEDLSYSAESYSEPAGPPTWPITQEEALAWLVALARNKRTVTATADVVRNDADNATIATSTLSDDGTTMTRGEYS